MSESTSPSASVSVSSLSVPSPHLLSSLPVTDSRSYPLTRPVPVPAPVPVRVHVPVPEATSISRPDPEATTISTSTSTSTTLWLQRYACSAISSATAEAATFPLDTVKVYRQLRPDGSSASASAAAAAQQVRLSVRSVPLLYCGVSPAICRSLVYGGITVTAYSPLRRWICGSDMDQEGKHAALWRKCVTGGLAGGAGQLVANPFDLAKSLMQQATRQRLIQQLIPAKSPAPSSTSFARPLTMFSVWHSIIAHEGIHGLWRGVVPCVQRAAIVNGSWIAVYDHSKWLVETALSPYEDSIRPFYRIVFTYTVASQLAGIVSCITSGPMDVVKTRLMTQSHNQHYPSHNHASTTTTIATTTAATASSTSSHPPYKGTLDCLRRVAAEEGPSALFRGFVPSLARVGPWSLVFFLVYESMSYRMFGTSQI